MKLASLVLSMTLLATNALSQHSTHLNSIAETGQSQFAAISEIVATLRSDPETNWQKVDIDALRNHLIDMDNVTTKAVVQQAVTNMNVGFIITGDATVSASIQRMVMAHSPMLQQATGWQVTAEQQVNGVTMRVQVESMEEADQIIGLGFFGLMTIGAHHQEHHLMIASGGSPH